MVTQFKKHRWHFCIKACRNLSAKDHPLKEMFSLAGKRLLMCRKSFLFLRANQERHDYFFWVDGRMEEFSVYPKIKTPKNSPVNERFNRTVNFIRPYQALDYLTPVRYY